MLFPLPEMTFSSPSCFHCSIKPSINITSSVKLSPAPTGQSKPFGAAAVALMFSTVPTHRERSVNVYHWMRGMLMEKELQEMTEGVGERREKYWIPNENSKWEISFITIRLEKMKKTHKALCRGSGGNTGGYSQCWKGGILAATCWKRVLAGCIKAFKKMGFYICMY